MSTLSTLVLRRCYMRFMSKKREQAAFIGEKVDYLFQHVLKPSGEAYTSEEVGEAIGKPASYVVRLRRKHIHNPGVEVLGALSDFFRVDRMYWFRPTTYIDENDPNYPYADVPQREVTPEEVAFVAEILTRIQQHEGHSNNVEGYKGKEPA